MATPGKVLLTDKRIMPPDYPILRLHNVIRTPHVANGTVDSDRITFQALIVDDRRV